MQNRQSTTATATAATTRRDAKQIVDVLPSYISIYKNSIPNPRPNPAPDRTTILKWFATLSPLQRVAHLTILDPTFTQLLLRMRRHNDTNNHRHSHLTFFLLPDIPATTTTSSSSRDPVPLPTLLTRRSCGFLARVAERSAESTRSLSDSVLLFSSREDVSTPCGAGSLDTVSFREEFLGDVDVFVGVMDTVSDYGFLNGPAEESAEVGLELAELRWLKGKGYYSLEEFVGNRVEVALRMAWLSANSSGGSGRKRGVKLKEKAKNVVGLGANVYWRKRGCVDWWERLDHGVKRSIFPSILRTKAKSLV